MKKSNLIGYSFFLVTILFFTGCAGTGTGAVVTKQSKFDNSKEVIMQTAWIAPVSGGMAELSLGMTYRSSSPNEILLLVNTTSMKAENLKNIAFNIDGSIINAKPFDDRTVNEGLKVTNDTSIYNYGLAIHQEGIKMQSSNKLFIAPSSLAENILNSSSAIVRVDTGGKFIEGDLKANSFGNATFKDSLPEFVSEMKSK